MIPPPSHLVGRAVGGPAGVGNATVVLKDAAVVHLALGNGLLELGHLARALDHCRLAVLGILFVAVDSLQGQTTRGHSKSLGKGEKKGTRNERGSREMLPVYCCWQSQGATHHAGAVVAAVLEALEARDKRGEQKLAVARHTMIEVGKDSAHGWRLVAGARGGEWGARGGR